MTELNYKLDVFEGPMDLLLHLITKHKLNIYDIPIIELVQQYTDYIRQMQELNLDVASEFLEMAARLIHIKSLSLLPVHEEGEQLRRELTGELIEYAECKKAAEALSLQTDGFNFQTRTPEKIESDMTYTRIHDPIELMNAYMRVMGKRLRNLPPKFDVFKPIVQRKIVSVSEKIKNIVSILSGTGKVRFRDIILRSKSRSELVAVFLAVLELAKTGNVGLSGDKQELSLELISVPEGELDFD
ncbi:MAG: segregation/condensation protein A [Oscillospiraceae bacterium]|nr:segregation/condensation protein A [Oscillospiraceae bacterium]